MVIFSCDEAVRRKEDKQINFSSFLTCSVARLNSQLTRQVCAWSRLTLVETAQRL